MTIDCLKSLTAVDTQYPFEVLVLDDATPKEDMSALASIAGLRYLRAETNRGFLRNVNWGAQQARGDIILLLNNDTIVDPDFLDPLVETLDDPTVGAVGSMLLYPAGIVQEAGGIIWNDASGWNYGRHDPEADSRNQWPREVDYCSGASLAVRRSLWEQLGGFDDRFAPAYYEDTDLCFAVRSLGFRVIYQPRSRVVHLEGMSHGTDISSGFKAYQEVNRQRFAEKWADELARQQPPGIDHLMAARTRFPGPRVAVVDHIFPQPDRDSGSVRMSQFVELLHELGYLVHFVPLAMKADGPLLERWQRMGIEVFYGDFDMNDIVAQLSATLDAIVLSRPHVASRLLLDIRWANPELPIIFDMVDSHGLRQRREAELRGDATMLRAADAVHRFEIGLCSAVDLVIAVSEPEAEMVRSEIGDVALVRAVPNIHPPVPEPAPLKGRDALLFVGGYGHPPNVDAAIWFVDEVRPLLADPSVRTVLAGSGPGDDVLALRQGTVEVPGWLEDLEPLYQRSRVVIAPLRFGAGVKGKIGEAMSYGVPVVTTSIGAEGLHLVDGEHCLIADDAESFAAAVDRVLGDDDLWHRLSVGGREHIESMFGRAAATERIRDVRAAVGCRVPAAEPRP